MTLVLFLLFVGLFLVVAALADIYTEPRLVKFVWQDGAGQWWLTVKRRGKDPERPVGPFDTSRDATVEARRFK